MKFFTTLIFSFLVFSLSAQFTQTKYYEIFLGPGVIVAFSDIGTYNPGYAANAGFRYRFDPHAG